MSKYLSAVQEEALKKPCPECGLETHEVGDLGDFDHNIVSCTDDACWFAMFFDGSLMDQ